MKFEIDAGAKKIIDILKCNGYSAYAVGGCIRDLIMGVPPHDWDICTSATPNDMLKAFRGYKIIETGLKHGTVTIMLDGNAYECTTYRIDGNYSDKQPSDGIEFAPNLKEDLIRRDFTINAMAYNDDEGLVDPFGGQNDIKKAIIRCVGSPSERFSEDALRIMRALRFSAKYGFSIDPSTKETMLNMADKLKNVSAERLNSELCKIISSSYGADVLKENADIVCTFIPEFKASVAYDQKNPYHDFDVYTHIMNALKNCESDDLTTRLAVLFHDIGKPYSMQEEDNGRRHFKGHGAVSADMTESIMKRLRFDNETRENVVQLIFYHDAVIEPRKKQIKRWLNKIGEKQFRRILNVRRADVRGQKTEYDKERVNKADAAESLLNEILAEEQCFSLKDLAINGKDLIELGVLPGKKIGEILNSLLSKVIDEDIENDHETLVNAAKTYIDKTTLV